MSYRQVKTPNLDPVIYQGGKILYNWLGWCLAYVQTAFGAGWSGSTAWQGWTTHTSGKHADRNIPKGVYVPIWFDGYWNGQRLGHVAIYRDGKIWSSPVSNKPYADTWSSIAAVEKAYGMRYVGWSEFVGSTRVIQKVATVTDAQIKQAYLDILERKADANGLKHYRAQVNKGWSLTDIRNDLLKSTERKKLLAKKEADRKKAEEAKKMAEAARIAAEKAAAEAEAKKTAEAEARAKAEAEKLAEEARKAQEEADRLAEEERKKKEEQAEKAPSWKDLEAEQKTTNNLLQQIINLIRRIFNIGD